MGRVLSRQETIAEYGRMLIKNPRSRVFVSMADACLREGKTRLALDVLEKGLRHHPGMGSALTMKGRALMALGRTAEAKETLRHAAHNSPENLLARRLLATLLLETGEPEQGLAALEESRRAWPGHAPDLYEKLAAAVREQQPALPPAAKPALGIQPREQGHDGAIETLERWLNNASRMTKG